MIEKDDKFDRLKFQHIKEAKGSKKRICGWDTGCGNVLEDNASNPRLLKAGWQVFPRRKDQLEYEEGRLGVNNDWGMFSSAMMPIWHGVEIKRLMVVH